MGSEKIGRGTAVSVAFCIISLIVVLICFFSPWYKITASVDYSYLGYSQSTEMDTNYYLSDIRMDMSDSTSENSTTEYTGAVGDTTGTTKMLISIGMLTLLGSTGLLIASTRKKNLMNFAKAMMAITLIILFMTPLYYLVALPSAFREDAGGDASIFGDEYNSPAYNFFGSSDSSDSSYDVQMSWGPGIGWYLPFIALVFTIISLAAASAKPKQTRYGYGQTQPGTYGQQYPGYPARQPNYNQNYGYGQQQYWNRPGQQQGYGQQSYQAQRYGADQQPIYPGMQRTPRPAVQPPQQARMAMGDDKMDCPSCGAGIGKDSETCQYCNHEIAPEGYASREEFRECLRTIFQINVPSHMEPETNSEIVINANNRTDRSFTNVVFDFADFEEFFEVQGDVGIRSVKPGTELEKRVAIKPRFDKGTFPLRITIKADGIGVDNNYTVKVGGTEIY